MRTNGLTQAEIDEMDTEERAAWSIVFSEHAGHGTFNFDAGTWSKPGEQPPPENLLPEDGPPEEIPTNG